MNKNYKIIGIIIISSIIITYLVTTYIGNGNKELLKNSNENIYVEEDNIDEEDSYVKEDNKDIKKEEIKDVSSNSNLIVVEIKGEVKNPSVYYVKEGCIIEDLIKEAGGLTENADTSLINKAEELTNHKCIIIPNINEKNIENTNNEGVIGSSDNKDEKVNINTASSEELQTLNGIGEAKAKAIIEYRESNGKFNKIEELTNVSGIGEASFQKIKEKITI